MIKAKRVGHATFETSDLDKAIAYYTEVNGLVLSDRQNGRAFLASKTGLLSIALEQGSAPQLKRLSFEVSPLTDFGDMAKQLATHGVRSEVRTDAIPGVGELLTFTDPAGTAVELFADWSYLGSHHQVHGAGPLKFGHIARVVDDPSKMAEF